MAAALALLEHLDRDDLIARVEALEAANDRLQDDLDALRLEKLGEVFQTPIDWGLTGTEARLFCFLMSRESCTKEACLTALYQGSPDEPEIKIIDVFVCKLRRKVEPKGILIETIWGAGYAMPPASKARARELMGEAPFLGRAL